MNKQTAIDLLDNLLGMVEDNHDSDYDTAIHMGIDALKTQLSKEDATFPVEGATLDCISRQQAILAIERNAYRREDINETEHIIRWVLDIIKWLPSVQPRWIPVSEALPKDDEEVIVTCLDDSGDTPFSYTTVAWHYKGMWVCENERCLFVIAWMPLPPSYKGGQDE